MELNDILSQIRAITIWRNNGEELTVSSAGDGDFEIIGGDIAVMFDRFDWPNIRTAMDALVANFEEGLAENGPEDDEEGNTDGQ